MSPVQQRRRGYSGAELGREKRAALQRYSLDEPQWSVRTAGHECPWRPGVLLRPRTCRFQPVLSHQARRMDGSAVLRGREPRLRGPAHLRLEACLQDQAPGLSVDQAQRTPPHLQGEAAGVHSPRGSTPQLSRHCRLRIWQGQVLG